LDITRGNHRIGLIFVNEQHRGGRPGSYGGLLPPNPRGSIIPAETEQASSTLPSRQN